MTKEGKSQRHGARPMRTGSLCPRVHLRAQANSGCEAETSDLSQGQKLLVVAFGDVDHQLLGTFWELAREESWAA